MTRRREQAIQRTTLMLPERLHKRIKLLAVRLDTTAGALTARALEEFLDREERKAPR